MNFHSTYGLKSTFSNNNHKLLIRKGKMPTIELCQYEASLRDECGTNPPILCSFVKHKPYRYDLPFHIMLVNAEMDLSGYFEGSLYKYPTTLHYNFLLP